VDIVWLGRGACGDCALIGGKGAGLCHLAADYHVPPTFCVTAAAFTRWAAHVDITRGRLPDPLYVQLEQAYRQMAADSASAAPRVAVRSSALDEDGQRASFAGQHQTLLNIIGVDAVAQAVVGCWASARSLQSLAYRRQQRLPLHTPMAVLVQQLVVADVAAVVFTANPVTGSRDEMVINASWGLGESIVSGTVTPDTLVVRKADLAVTMREVGSKEQMTVLGLTGTRTMPVPRLMRRQPSLSDDRVVALARLGLALEQWMGQPVDVECAYSGETLYLLQCRPITTV
jgi:phosphoenolpyruvate synthase/pyruvate phosphate dikinase